MKIRTKTGLNVDVSDTFKRNGINYNYTYSFCAHSNQLRLRMFTVYVQQEIETYGGHNQMLLAVADYLITNRAMPSNIYHDPTPLFRKLDPSLRKILKLSDVKVPDHVKARALKRVKGCTKVQ